MPFRFRKSISLGKGFRLNLSKGGISSTFGVKGVHLNVGKQGVRPTVGLPGTGLSFTPSTAQSDNPVVRSTVNVVMLIVSVLALCVIGLCCIGLLFTSSGSTQSTPTVTIFAPGTAIIQTSNAAISQTKIFSTPTPNVTSTSLPTLTPAATLSVIATLQPPTTLQPYVVPTNPRPSVGNLVCDCSGDALNCTDFSSQAAAQACMNYCIAQGAGDIHNLDGNVDGVACESLP